jgi:hypothetical protein
MSGGRQDRQTDRQTSLQPHLHPWPDVARGDAVGVRHAVVDDPDRFCTQLLSQLHVLKEPKAIGAPVSPQVPVAWTILLRNAAPACAAYSWSYVACAIGQLDPTRQPRMGPYSSGDRWEAGSRIDGCGITHCGCPHCRCGITH